MPQWYNLSMINSFRYAGEGIVWSVKNHRNLRIFVLLGILVLLLSFLLGVTREEFLILFFTIIMCLITEMLNTALEEMTDLITIKWSQQAKIAKDVGAGMSLIAALSALVVGILIFTPYIQAYIK